VILYEHPLNERIRNYLKLEQLFAQAKQCHASEINQQFSVYFNALFAILDTLERNDVKGELIKDLERLEKHLVLWSNSPHIDDKAIEDNLAHIVSLACDLKAANSQWQAIKNDKLLSSIKQRFAIQGGSSLFDLPQLQFWLNQPTQVVEKQMTTWLAKLEQTQDAIALVLKFIRERAEFQSIATESGFFQDNGEGLLLLRIKLAADVDYFPTVSGNRFRYSIRFMCPCDTAGRRYCSQPTSFELARC